MRSSRRLLEHPGCGQPSSSSLVSPEPLPTPLLQSLKARRHCRLHSAQQLWRAQSSGTNSFVTTVCTASHKTQRRRGGVQGDERGTPRAARLVKGEGGGVRGENARGDHARGENALVRGSVLVMNRDNGSSVRGGLAGGDASRLAGETLFCAGPGAILVGTGVRCCCSPSS